MMVDTFHGKISVLCTRDDLIRLVVSRQWRELCGPSGPEVNPGADLRPAVDIVDEWLGVR